MQWLHDLPHEQLLKVIDLAVETRQSVRKDYKGEEEQRIRERKQNIEQAHIRREALKQKAQQERQVLHKCI